MLRFDYLLSMCVWNLNQSLNLVVNISVFSDLKQNLIMTSTDSSKISDNPLYVSWCDSAWIPVLNQGNVMDYFTERTNPFYDRTCNNEVLKMQKLGVLDAQLTSMQGTEYCLLHVQEPILYVIRQGAIFFLRNSQIFFCHWT